MDVQQGWLRVQQLARPLDPAQHGGGEQVERRAVRQQKVDHRVRRPPFRRRPVVRGQVERRSSASVAGRDVGPMLQQHPRRLWVAPVRRVMERRATCRIAGIGIGAVGEEPLHRRLMSALGGQVERGLTVHPRSPSERGVVVKQVCDPLALPQSGGAEDVPLGTLRPEVLCHGEGVVPCCVTGRHDAHARLLLWSWGSISGYVDSLPLSL
jgi:hypothetical protein